MAENPRGIFNRSSKGQRIAPQTVQVERGRIRFFAQVLGERDQIHLDVDAARAAGHPDLVAPASFAVVVEALANEARNHNGQATAPALIKADFRYLLHGEERYFYEAPIYAGEDVQISTDIVDFYDKKGGAMEFVVLESVISNARRGVLVRSRRLLLHRLPEMKS